MKFRHLFATLLSAASLSAHAHIVISPDGPILVGDELKIRLDQLPPHSPVRVRVERTYGGKSLWQSETDYRSDDEGRVDLSTAPPEPQSHRSAGIQGLFWSMTKVGNGLPEGMKAYQLRITEIREGQSTSAAVLDFRPSLPEVAIEKVPGFSGALFAHLPGNGPRPVVIVLGGSEGNDSFAKEVAPELASRGFAALGLPYYSPPDYARSSRSRELPDLPSSFIDIPIDRVDDAYRWLSTRPDVDKQHVGILGISMGAEYALLAASEFPWVKSVVAIAPADVVTEGWGGWTFTRSNRPSFSYKGQPFPFVPADLPSEQRGFMTGRPVILRRAFDAGRAENPQSVEKARIRIDRFKGELLVIGGGDDKIWASATMAQNIAEFRTRNGLTTTLLTYPEAGHDLNGNGFRPALGDYGGPLKVGGSPESNARAQADAYPKILAFLQRTLKTDTPP